MFGFRKAKAQPRAVRPPPVIPSGKLIYAIGDVHGRADLLRQLLDIIRQDYRQHFTPHPATLVFLGDYVDRGGASNQVIETLLELQGEPSMELMALRGNHDQFLLDFLTQPLLGKAWINFGGSATLAAYGVPVPKTISDDEAWIATSQQLAEAIPQEHIAFLEATHYCATFGDYVFVHAGVRPGIELQEQRPADLLSIRETFLATHDALPGRVVVFGHTPFEMPLVEGDKVGIDTGACATGVLTALALFNDTRRFLQTGDRAAWPVPEPILLDADRPRRL